MQSTLYSPLPGLPAGRGKRATPRRSQAPRKKILLEIFACRAAEKHLRKRTERVDTIADPSEGRKLKPEWKRVVWSGPIEKKIEHEPPTSITADINFEPACKLKGTVAIARCDLQATSHGVIGGGRSFDSACRTRSSNAILARPSGIPMTEGGNHGGRAERGGRDAPGPRRASSALPKNSGKTARVPLFPFASSQPSLRNRNVKLV